VAFAGTGHSLSQMSAKPSFRKSDLTADFRLRQASGGQVGELSRAATPDTSGCCFQSKRLHQKGDVFGRFHLSKYRRDLLVGTDYKGRALGAEIFLPVQAFFDPDTKGIDNLVVRIAQERERQSVFLNELLVAGSIVDADPEKFGPRLDVAPRVSKLTSLFCAARRVVLRIEVQNERRALKVRQFNWLSNTVDSAHGCCGKMRGWIADFEFHKQAHKLSRFV
jgi:hypothetical protein